MSRRGAVDGLARHAMMAILAAASAAGPAFAGPPYLSDDPEPTDTRHWEIYNFVAGLGGPGALEGQAGLDLNYGGAKDLQLTAVLPLDFTSAGAFNAAGLRGGPGDIQLAAKYRFLHQADGGWLPDVSLFPRLFVPTGERRFETGRANLFLPVWAEKDFGSWSVFGGGGYQINPGPGQLDFWQGGVAVTREVTKRLSIGAEAYGQTRDTIQGGAYQAMDLGLTYQLVKHWSLLISAGPTRGQDGDYGQVFYLSLKADY